MKVLEIGAKKIAAAFLILFGLAGVSSAQSPLPRPSATPTLIINQMKRDMPIAAGNNLYCAGYIQNSPVNIMYQIIGADDEHAQNLFVQNDFVYINRGANKGAYVGEMLAVVRPRGKFSTRHSKKGKLGVYVQEVGALEIVKVKPEVSVARIYSSCESFLLGDLLQPIPTRVSPPFQTRPALDLFGEPTGKALGRIVLARDGREAPSREDIVYIDLGAEDNVQAGNYLTIFRPLGKGDIHNGRQIETLRATNEGFESKTFRGGKFSNQAPRREGTETEFPIVTSRAAIKNRPQDLRKVVGELVILNVKERTATAVITRTTEEIHTGDMVEVQ